MSGGAADGPAEGADRGRHEGQPADRADGAAGALADGCPRHGALADGCPRHVAHPDSALRCVRLVHRPPPASSAISPVRLQSELEASLSGPTFRRKS